MGDSKQGLCHDDFNGGYTQYQPPPSSGAFDLSLPKVEFVPTPTINPAEKAVEQQYGTATPVQPSGERNVGGGVTFSWGNQNTFDQYKYGEMRDGAGNLIQSGPTSDGSSFDYRYTMLQRGQSVPKEDKIPIVDDVISAVGEFFSGKPSPKIPFRAADIGPLAQSTQQPYDASKLYSPLSVTKSSVVPEPIIQVLTPQTTRAAAPAVQPTQWTNTAIQPAQTDWSDVIGLMQAANRPRQVTRKKSTTATPFVIMGIGVAILVAVAVVKSAEKVRGRRV